MTAMDTKLFFANRIGEIQKTGATSDWWWVPGNLNIADIITRGAGPKDLDEVTFGRMDRNSLRGQWRNGPKDQQLKSLVMLEKE